MAKDHSSKREEQVLTFQWGIHTMRCLDLERVFGETSERNLGQGRMGKRGWMELCVEDWGAHFQPRKWGKLMNRDKASVGVAHSRANSSYRLSQREFMKEFWELTQSLYKSNTEMRSHIPVPYYWVWRCDFSGFYLGNVGRNNEWNHQDR